MNAAQGKPAITVKDLTVTIQKRSILEDISTTIPTGSITGLLGPSGAGKTTLIKAILGLKKYSHGSISVFDQPPGHDSLRSRIGYMTQSPAMYFDLTVRENLNYFAALDGVDEDAVINLVREVDLKDQYHQLIRDLSGGEKTRVSLITALLGNPPLLLLDEPTVGLDPVLREKLWAKFNTLSQAGTTIVITSHVMDEANKCDNLLFIRDGRLIAQGDPQQILEAGASQTMEQAFLNLAQETRG